MRNARGYFGLGLLLILVGILFLLQNFGLVGEFSNLIWVVLFGAGGLAFLWVFANNPENWWAVIPGFALLGIAGLIALGDRLGAWGGALFLGGIGLSFWVIYAMRREFWWAVIPGGALTTLALVAGASEFLPGEAVGGLFFLGMAATFGLVYLLPTPEGRMKWALIPAGIMAVMGVMLMLMVGNLINFIWPIVLIIGGGYLLLRAFVLPKK